MMIKTGPFCLAILVAGSIVAGCNSGNVTEEDQQAKVKAMNDIAKEDTSHVDRPGGRR